MGLETGSYIDDLVVTNPIGSTDPKSQGDNHLRLIKTTLKNTFPGMAGRAWRFQDQSGNYNAVVTDNMSVINMTGADKTVNLPAVGTVGNGFMLLVVAATGSGTVTLDGDTTETINGALTLDVPEGWLAMLFCTGSEWVGVLLPVTVAQNIQIICLRDGSVVPITSGTDKYVLNAFPGCEVLAIWASLAEASSSGNVVIDVNLDGTTIMSANKLTIEAGETSTLTAGTQPALTTTTIPHGSKVSTDYDSAGSDAVQPSVFMAVVFDTSLYS